MKEELLTIEESYKAMVTYLENLYNLTGSDDLAIFLGSMAMLPDGKPKDPAIWQDWQKAIQLAKAQDKSECVDD